MEEAAGQAKSPDSVKVLLPPSDDTFIVTQDSIVYVDKLSRRLDSALRVSKDAARSDCIKRQTPGTKPEKRCISEQVPKLPVDGTFQGEAKVGRLVVQQLELENTMAWLSTLGGAFSALGDYDFRFAEAACQVSVKQLKLALHIGDPVTVCRCHIYLAMSLLQRGYFHSCRRLLRKQYQFAISKEGQRDPKLAKMCQSVWIRMQYLRSQQEKQPQL